MYWLIPNRVGPAVLVSLSNLGLRAVGVSLRPARGGRPVSGIQPALALVLLAGSSWAGGETAGWRLRLP